MRCTQARKRLSAYQDRALGETQRSAVEEHLTHCPDCTAVVTGLERTWQALDLGEAIETSPGFVVTVMRRVQAGLPQPAWQAPRWAVAAALIVFLTCGGLAGYVHSNAPQAAPVRQLALATDVARQLGLEAFAPAPADTVAGAYAQFTGAESGR